MSFGCCVGCMASSVVQHEELREEVPCSFVATWLCSHKVDALLNLRGTNPATVQDLARILRPRTQHVVPWFRLSAASSHPDPQDVKGSIRLSAQKKMNPWRAKAGHEARQPLCAQASSKPPSPRSCQGLSCDGAKPHPGSSLEVSCGIFCCRCQVCS